MDKCFMVGCPCNLINSGKTLKISKALTKAWPGFIHSLFTTRLLLEGTKG